MTVSALPITPFYIDDTTTPCDRLEILEQLTAEGCRYALVRARADAARLAAPFQTPEAIASACLRDAQRLNYHHDPDGEDWFQSCWYSALHGGDCEDLATYVASLLRLNGLCARVVWINQPEHSLNHVTCQVWLDGAWNWADPSIRGAALGESPYQAIERLGQWHVIGLPEAQGDTSALQPAGHANLVKYLARAA